MKIPIKTCDSVSLGTIEFRSRKGELIGLITNIGVNMNPMDMAGKLCECGHKFEQHTWLDKLGIRGRCLIPASVNSIKCDCQQFREQFNFRDKCQDPNGCQQDCKIECRFYENLKQHQNGQLTQTRNGSPFFYKLLEKMANIHDKKSHDYAMASNPFSNFERSGLIASWFTDPVDISFASLIGVKLARLAELRSNNGETPKVPNNESIADTFLDLATYAGLWAAYSDSKELVKSSEEGQTDRNYRLRHEAIKELDNILDETNLNSKLRDYQFHRDLQKLLNVYSVDNEMNIADHTLSTLIITHLLKLKTQMG